MAAFARSRFVALCLLAVLGLAGAAWADDVAAQVRHCVAPDGKDVFTDRRCADVGAVEKAAEPAGSVQRVYRGGCAHTLQDLLFEMTSAIDAGDVNRLASLYHWPGTSSGSARNVMEELDTIVHRPLVGIVPLTPPGYGGYRFPAEPGPPGALRIEQTLDNGSTPAATTFALQEYFGCLWIRG